MCLHFAATLSFLSSSCRLDVLLICESVHVQYALFASLLQSEAQVERAQEAELRAKYPNVKSRGASALLQKRLSKGVSFLFHSVFSVHNIILLRAMVIKRVIIYANISVSLISCIKHMNSSCNNVYVYVCAVMCDVIDQFVGVNSKE